MEGRKWCKINYKKCLVETSRCIKELRGVSVWDRYRSRLTDNTKKLLTECHTKSWQLFQWVPSHAGLPGNEVADDLAKAAANDPVDPKDRMPLTLTEIYSRAKELICRTWDVPPVHPRFFEKQSESAISFKGFKFCQTAFSRFLTDA
ncbi:RNase H domain-containing protein [Trichonephila clavipes]|nr:RNase H domain-containing protein [Trichonephila clavipes]